MREIFVFGVPVRVAGTVTDIVIVLSGNLSLAAPAGGSPLLG
jgi:hypothetical protein